MKSCPKPTPWSKTPAAAWSAPEIIVREHPLKWEMIPFDVQLVGGIALHQGKIAEMATGEGKTLVATMPVYLNALTGRGVHVVTVNDYLAARDSEWMGAVYRFLGLTVGCILRDQSPAVRREQYNCDITYGTNSEFGFDYLRDNGMAMRREEQVQRGHYFAIVDEVDSILIDEARTPLIISGPSVLAIDNKYDQFKPVVESLERAQEKLCARFLAEARGSDEEAAPRRRLQSGPPGGAGKQNRPAAFSRQIGLPPLGRFSEGAGKPGEPAADEPGRIGVARRSNQEGPLCREGGTVLRHGREEPRRRPDRKRAALHAAPGPGRLRAAGFDRQIP